MHIGSIDMEYRSQRIPLSLEVAEDLPALMTASFLSSSVLDALDIGVVVLDQQRHVRHWNTWMTRASRLQPDAVVPRSLFDVFPAHRSTRLEEAIAQALALGASTVLTETLNGEMFPLHGPDGRRLHHNVLVSRWEDGADAFCLIQVQDVTARHTAEAALRRSEDHYRQSVELNPQVPWTADADGVVAFSKRWLTLTGLNPRELLGDGREQAVHHDDLPHMDQMWTASVRTGIPYDVEHRVRLADGSYRWMRSRAVPRLDKTGSVVRWYGTMEDIHDRKQAEEALRRSEERLRRALDTETVGVIFFDPAGTIKEANDAFLGFSGFTQEDVVAGRLRWQELTPPEHMPVSWQAFNELTTTGRATPYEKEYFRKDGSRWWGLFAPRLLAEGEAVEFILEITERKCIDLALRKAHDKAEEARRVAEEADRAKSRFLAAASHDLRQPVQSLFFLLSALEGRIKPGAEKTLSHATESLSALKSLLDSLLDISRLDSGAVEPEISEFPISTLLEQIDAEYRPIAEAQSLDWHVTASNATVRSDPALLGRILRNLCQNAIRYTETGSVLLTWGAVRNTVRIKVQDTGIGIPPDKLDDIFQEFHQLDNTHRDRNQGLGLGLAIVQRLSKLLGHPVEVHSTLGEGSTFSITVPLAAALSSEVAEAQIIPIAQGVGEFVVVIDDDELVRLGVRILIESWGYDVLEAASVPQALAMLRECCRIPDLVVSDYRLPQGKDGVAAIREIRALFGAKIPAVLLTGENMQEPNTELAAEDITVAHKPISPSQLHTLLKIKLPAVEKGQDKAR